MLSALGLMTGCATIGGAPSAFIEIEKLQQTSNGDCPVNVRIYNRMRAPWDGVSYHVVFRNSKKATIGELRAIPRRYIEPGYGLALSSHIRGTDCHDITDLSVVYFGYYVPGGGQIKLRPNRVKAEIK